MLAESVDISFGVNALGKGMNPCLLPSVMDKLLGRWAL